MFTLSFDAASMSSLYAFCVVAGTARIQFLTMFMACLIGFELLFCSLLLTFDVYSTLPSRLLKTSNSIVPTPDFRPAED